MSENPKPPKQSPYSPFPFGSPLGLNVSKGTSEAASNGLTSRTSPSSSSATFLSTLNSSFLKGRVRAKEAYGGKIHFILTVYSFNLTRKILRYGFNLTSIDLTRNRTTVIYRQIYRYFGSKNLVYVADIVISNGCGMNWSGTAR